MNISISKKELNAIIDVTDLLYENLRNTFEKESREDIKLTLKSLDSIINKYKLAKEKH